MHNREDRQTAMIGTSTRQSESQRAGGWCKSGISADAEWIRELRPERASK
jgi:hypothetical protein